MTAVYEDGAEKIRWRLRHRNGTIMADSGQGHSGRDVTRGSLERVDQTAPGAESEPPDGG